MAAAVLVCFACGWILCAGAEMDSGDAPVNLYDPSLQRPETISPHYYVDGEPYSSTQFDSAYNCTALIPVEPDTVYTIGMIPAMEGMELPWGYASYGWFLYDANEVYLGQQGADSVITTGPDAAYLRFNYGMGAYPTVDLEILKERCMIVKGSVLPDKYIAYSEKPVQGKADAGTGSAGFAADLVGDVALGGQTGFEYKFSGGDLLLGYGYNDECDAVVVLNNGRANGLFDFDRLCLKPKGEPLDSFDTDTLEMVWHSGTDMHAPFQFLAIKDADGYHAKTGDAGFVGGNHTLDQLGDAFRTAESKYVHFYADGRPVSQGCGWCTHFEIRWANEVQAYNTVKEGWGGRACLTEYHDMIFDGVLFTEEIQLTPTEDIRMNLWYGLQFVSYGNVYPNITYIGGKNRQAFPYESGKTSSGNTAPDGMIAWGPEHAVEILVDTGFDLGKRPFYKGNDGAFTSGDKGYFNIINGNYVFNAGTNYYLRGSFRFFPAVQ